MQFVHLHNHTHYSLLDGASTVQSLVNAAVANKMPAVALTDHGVLFGECGCYGGHISAHYHCVRVPLIVHAPPGGIAPAPAPAS